MAQRAASGEILETAGYEKLAEGYNAWDMTAIAIDAVMGGAFGYVARNQRVPNITEGLIGKNATDAITRNVDSTVRAFVGNDKLVLSAKELDEVSALGNKKSLVYDSAPARPLNDEAVNSHTATITDAIDDMLSGRPIDVNKHFDGSERFEPIKPDTEFSAAFREAANELGVKLEAEDAPQVEVTVPIDPIVPLAKPETTTKQTKQPKGIDGDYQVVEAMRYADNVKDLMIESDSGLMVSAKKEMKAAITAHKTAVELESGFKAAALCVLGG
jgi:hypothetical protein